MKTDSLDINRAIAPFAQAIGEINLPKILNDIKSMLGRAGGADDKNVAIKLNDWKATSGFKLKRTTGETLQLPANNPATILLCFGMQMVVLAGNAECDIQSSIPNVCKAWVKEHSLAPQVKA